MQYIKIPSNIYKFIECPVDLQDVEISLRRFFLKLRQQDRKFYGENCLEAKHFLTEARILLRNLLVLEENEYLNKNRKAFYWMLDNLGRVDKRLTIFEENTLKVLENFSLREGVHKIGKPGLILSQYRNVLTTLANHLVYFPILNALQHFKEYPNETENGEKVIKDADLFLYFLFLELYHSSESLGAISSEETKKQPQHPAMAFAYSSHEEVSDFDRVADRPTHEPPNIKIEQSEETQRDKIEQLKAFDIDFEDD